MEAQRRKRNELVGEAIFGGKSELTTRRRQRRHSRLLTDATEMFLQHVRVHSPDKPRTVRRYGDRHSTT